MRKLSSYVATKRCTGHDRRPLDERGQSFVEFALLFPVLIIVIIGVVDLGRAIYTDVTLSFAVRDGCRQAIVAGVSTDDVKAAVINAAPAAGLTSADVTVTGTRASGTTVTVIASVPFVPLTPLVAQVAGDSLILTASSSMIVD
jgi:Flp pilus assembly protein TadG